MGDSHTRGAVGEDSSINTNILGAARVSQAHAMRWATRRGHSDIMNIVSVIWSLSAPVRPEVQLVQFVWETGWGTSKVWRERNNPAGIKGAGPYRTYPFPRAGLEAHRDLLLRYCREGRDTIEKMAARWAEDKQYAARLKRMLSDIGEDMPEIDPDKVCGGCGLELTEEEQKEKECPRCGQVWPTPERD